MKRNLKIAAGFVLSAVILAVLFRGTRWGDVAEELRNADFVWLAASQVCLWLAIFARIERWKPIVRASGPATYRTMFNATQIGFLANWALPGRAGELVRAVLLTRLGSFPLTQSIALVALDRITDLVGLVSVLLVALIAYRPSQDIVLPPELFTKPIPVTLVRTGAVSAIVLLLTLSAVTLLFYLNRKLAVRIADACTGAVSQSLQRRVHTMLDHVTTGMQVFDSVGATLRSALFSVLTWLGYVGALACIFQAFSIRCPWYTPFLAQALLSIAITLPAAPAFLGQFHAGIIAGLLMAEPSIGLSTAKAAAILTHVCFLAPVALSGAYALIRENVGLFEIEKAGLSVADSRADLERATERSEVP